jgi:hypothetical protein
MKLFVIGTIVGVIIGVAGATVYQSHAPTDNLNPPMSSTADTLPPQLPPLRPEWRVTTEQNKMDGTAVTTAALSSSSKSESIILRCEKAKLEAYITTDDVLESDDGLTKVRVKFDQAGPVKELWSISTDRVAAFSRRPSVFLTSILSSSRLDFEYAPFDKREKVTDFDLTGAATDISALVRACPPTPATVGRQP